MRRRYRSFAASLETTLTGDIAGIDVNVAQRFLTLSSKQQESENEGYDCK